MAIPPSSTDMKDYVSGGYYVVKAIRRPEGVSEILPDTLITISDCFTSVISDIIQLQWDKYEEVVEAIGEEAAAFGISQDQLPELIHWAKAQNNTNYVVYEDVRSPVELLSRFIKDTSAHVVGIGLHSSLLSSFQSQLTKDVNNGFGLAEVVNDHKPLAPRGRPLGYEPLGFTATKFHSWLCHYTPDEAFRRFEIRPNQLGLIDEFEQARQVTEYLVETGAEPAIWEPWLLLDYAPCSTKRTAVDLP